MLENHRDRPTFRPEYHYANPETDESYSAPFPVAVYGIDRLKSFFGVGNVIGSIDTPLFGGHPVIEVEDIEDKQPYTILGIESYWQPLSPEIIEGILSGKLAAASIRRYLLEKGRR